ncbi:unnamed protein product, partial [Prorocentrum cordatum]
MLSAHGFDNYLILVQEHHARDDRFAEVQSKAAAKGFRGARAEAIDTGRGGSCGGVAVIAPVRVLVSAPPQLTDRALIPGRLVAAHAHWGRAGGIVLLSVHLVVGEGLGAQNLEIVQTAIDYAREHGIEAELCDRNDIVKASERRKFCGRAGPPSYSRKPLPRQADLQPKAELAWRAVGRWLRQLRSVRTKLCQLASEYASDPTDERFDQVAKQFYFLQGFLKRIRKSSRVLEVSTESIREFLVDVPSSFCRVEFDDAAQGFLDEIEAKLLEFGHAARAEWKKWVEQVQELIAETSRPQPFQQADDCLAEWEAIWEMH